MTSTKFEKDLKTGHLYEQRSLLYLEYDEYKIMEGYFKEYDIEIIKNNEIIKIEVKSDKQAALTGNLAIEYECNNKKSGIASSTADFYIYFIVFDNYEEVFKIPLDELKKIVKKCKKTTGGDGNRSKMYLLPKKIVENYLIKILKNNITPYIQPMTTEQKPMTYNQKLIEHFKKDGAKSYDIDEIEKLINYFSKVEFEKKKEKTDEMPFGKYKFKKVKDIAEFDKQYLIWLSKQDMLNKYVELKAEINKYI